MLQVEAKQARLVAQQQQLKSWTAQEQQSLQQQVSAFYSDLQLKISCLLLTDTEAMSICSACTHVPSA